MLFPSCLGFMGWQAHTPAVGVCAWNKKLSRVTGILPGCWSEMPWAFMPESEAQARPGAALGFVGTLHLGHF